MIKFFLIIAFLANVFVATCLLYPAYLARITLNKALSFNNHMLENIDVQLKNKAAIDKQISEMAFAEKQLKKSADSSELFGYFQYVVLQDNILLDKLTLGKSQKIEICLSNIKNQPENFLFPFLKYFPQANIDQLVIDKNNIQMIFSLGGGKVKRLQPQLIKAVPPLPKYQFLSYMNSAQDHEILFEQVPLAELRLVGTLIGNKKAWAIFSNKQGEIKQAEKSDQVGIQHQRIKTIIKNKVIWGGA